MKDQELFAFAFATSFGLVSISTPSVRVWNLILGGPQLPTHNLRNIKISHWKSSKLEDCRFLLVTFLLGYVKLPFQGIFEM